MRYLAINKNNSNTMRVEKCTWNSFKRNCVNYRIPSRRWINYVQIPSRGHSKYVWILSRRRSGYVQIIPSQLVTILIKVTRYDSVSSSIGVTFIAISRRNIDRHQLNHHKKNKIIIHTYKAIFPDST